jgi:hypothetical protein
MLNDTGIPYEHVYEHFSYVDEWAREHCKSYCRYDAVDVSDVSLTNDVIAEYCFNDEKDAVLFKLKWS